MKKTKIAFCIISNGLGGAEKVLLELLNGINKDRFEVFLIVNEEVLGYYESNLCTEKIFSLGNVYPFLNNRLIQRLLIKVRPLFDISKILVKFRINLVSRFLKKNNIEVIHSHLMYDLFLCTSIVKKDKCFKLVYTLHGFLNLKEDKNLRYVFNHENFIEMLNVVDVITCVSSHIECYIKNNFPLLASKVLTITNGIPNNYFNGKFNADLELKSLICDKKKFRFLFIGGDKKVKGGTILVDAIKLFENFPIDDDFDFEFYFAGHFLKGSLLLNRINNDFYLSSKIKLFGYLNVDEMNELYSKVDFLIMPSLSEGYPLAAVESINQGVPVIGSNINAFKLMFGDKYLINLAPEDMMMMISRLMNDDDFKKEFVSSFIGFNIVVWSDLIDKYERLYLIES
jgi:glycosyltransferase involved in cell wall biosynthesis